MLLAFEGKQIPIDDAYLEEYRHTTGMDIDSSYIPYRAGNEGVEYQRLSIPELSSLIKRGMALEMDIARGF